MTLYLENNLAKRKKLGNLRSLQLNPNLVDFSSNDILGLARSKQLVKATFKELKRGLTHENILGSTGSRLITGNYSYAQNLESFIALFHGYETATLFNCGYMANVGLLSTLGNLNTVIFFDERVHASTRDGIRLSQSKAFPFKHNDLEHLEKRLKSNFNNYTDRFICIESIYSLDGSIAPLFDIYHLAKKYQANVIVDEAHATGIFGPSGRGLLAKYNLTSDTFAHIVTFGKALGTFGAVILGNHLLKDALINYARSFIYTTALPLVSLVAIKCAYDIFPQLEQERQTLHQLIRLFCQKYPEASTTHIQSIKIKGNQAAKHATQFFVSKGFDVRPFLSPTVPKGHEMIRICLHTFNTKKQLEQLLDCVEQCRNVNNA
ncbi:8-amino-7-oxononanoate synthase 2 [Candidatus Rubidus massiliensis]|nr:MAG: hypothetical protein BGO10_08565 [Chlamydia sp. 32-24]CDZ80253.1 8-amino-7-oxononanoate synthase 2 [Candidatus Rubidus massiliensis]